MQRKAQIHPLKYITTTPTQLIEIVIENQCSYLKKINHLCPYFPVDVVVTAAVIAILVSVSKEPVDDFLVLMPLTLLLSITAEVLSGGGKALVLTANNNTTINNSC